MPLRNKASRQTVRRGRSAAAAERRTGYTLQEIAARLGGEVLGDARVTVSRVAPLAAAAAGDLAVLAQSRHLPELASCGASAVVVGVEARDATELPRIVAANPYAYFARALALFNPEAPVRAGVDRTGGGPCLGPGGEGREHRAPRRHRQRRSDRRRRCDRAGMRNRG